MLRSACALVTAAFCLSARADWGLVDAVYGHSSTTSSSFPADAVKSMWPFHSDESYITGSAVTSGRPASEEYSGARITRGENDWAPERVYACG